MADSHTMVWRHYTGTADANGVLSVGSVNDVGTKAIAGGGFGIADNDASPSSNEDETWTGSQSLIVPLVGTVRRYSAVDDTARIDFLFQATPYAQVRTHTYVIL